MLVSSCVPSPLPRTRGTGRPTEGEERSGEQRRRQGPGQLQHSEVGEGDQQGAEEGAELREEKRSG